jgi:hypothetical protein
MWFTFPAFFASDIDLTITIIVLDMPNSTAVGIVQVKAPFLY